MRLRADFIDKPVTIPILLPMRFHILTIFILASTLAGCAGRNIYPLLNEALQAGDCQGATVLMADSQDAYGSNNQLGYLLDSAMVNLQCRNFEQAQEALHAAEQLADKLWTESLSRNVVAMVTNDYTLPYSGEDYERVMIHLVSAIAYLQMDELDEALVEIRRLDSLLGMFADKYRDDEVYKKDAFGRYLSGVLHEADGADDDAFIDYLKAAQIYQNEWQRYGTPLPGSLVVDLLRMADTVHRMDDAVQVVPADAMATWQALVETPASGEVVAIVFSGEGPHKIQDIAAVATPRGPISIAFPRIVTGDAPCRGGEMLLLGPEDSYRGRLDLVADINQIALKALEDRRGRIVAKAVARAVAKQVVITSLASTQKDKGQQQAVAALLNVANLLALERADTRCWETLPGNILLAKTLVAPGEYDVQLQMCGARTFDLGTVRLDAGQTRFLFLDTHFKRPTSQP